LPYFFKEPRRRFAIKIPEHSIRGKARGLCGRKLERDGPGVNLAKDILCGGSCRARGNWKVQNPKAKVARLNDQNPITKIQRNSKHQTPTSCVRWLAGSLVFELSLNFGV
jgi:hypothetical protein